MITEPLFSVVLPTRNRAHLLPRAVNSVLAQGFSGFELLVVDDSSTDHTQSILRGYDDRRLRTIRNSQQLGAAASRNRAITASRAPWLAFLDDDDAYRPGFLESMRQLLSTAPETVGFAWCGVRRLRESEEGITLVDAEGTWQPSYCNRRAAYLGFIEGRRIGTNCGLTVRRTAIDAVGGFDERLQCAEDTDLLIRLAADFEFVIEPAILVDVHFHGGPRLTRYGAQMAAAYRRICEKYVPSLADAPGTRDELLYKTGWLHYHAGLRDAGRRYLTRALRARPLRLRSWASLLLFELLGARAPKVHTHLSRLRRRGLGPP